MPVVPGIAEPLVELTGPSGDGGPCLYAAPGALDAAGAVGAQFTEDAATYDDRYLDPHGLRDALDAALDLAAARPGPGARVLDAGCGSGNATLALLDLLPGCTVVATDASPDLLRLLAEHLASRPAAGARVRAVLADAERLRLEPGAFDLVVVSSALHHLVDPWAAVARLLDAVAPGGTACFLEPFLPGHVVLRQAVDHVCALAAHQGGVDPGVVDALRRYSAAIDAIAAPDTASAAWRSMDDKWLFTRSQFERAAADAGCTVAIRTTNPLDESMAEKICDVVHASTGRRVELPGWACEYLAGLDALRTPAAREDLLCEGAVVVSKGA